MEASFMKVLAFAPDAKLAGTWAQWLHAMIAPVAALACAGAARSVARDAGASAQAITASGWFAAIALLSTPWIIATGSLAYTELPVVMAMALVVLVLNEPSPAPRCGVMLLAIVCAAAIGSKGNAAGALVLPTAVLAAVTQRGSWRSLLWPSALAIVVAAVALMPWWLRNWIDAGQPFFPFVAALGPGDWWTVEQQRTFAAAHAAPPGWGLAALWNEWLRYGIGPNPDASEPWRPQWLLLPWLGLLGVMFTLRVRQGRVPRGGIVLAVLVVANLVFWIAFTHQKSRFLVPIAAPMAIAAGVLLGALAARGHAGSAVAPRSIVARAARVGVSVLAIGMACAVPWWFATDGRAGAPAAAIGAEDVFTGEALGDELRAAGAGDDAWLETARAASPAFVLNEMLAPCDRVISLGENRGWYCNRIPDYHTVWDRGLLERLLADGMAPAECVRELRTTGYSHVVVDHSMLRRWRASGWLDARLTDERVRQVLALLDPVAETAGECSVHRIPRADAP
jgi:4-amino-4-deoxy-L-arabinose transferase-like glycosyltransferase